MTKISIYSGFAILILFPVIAFGQAQGQVDSVPENPSQVLNNQPVELPSQIQISPEEMTEVVPNEKTEVSSLSKGVSVTKDVFQIFFFIVVGCLAVLSYLQARKSLFTPIRTETFKMQIKAFEDVLLFFEKHVGSNIEEAFGFDLVFHLNAREMFDAYIMAFFRDDIDINKLLEAREQYELKSAGALVTGEFMEANFELDIDHTRKKPNADEVNDDRKNPAIIASQWAGYSHGMIFYTKKYFESQGKVRQFQISPVLPKKLKELIADFDKIVTDNLFILGTVLTEASQEMPEKYPTVDAMKKSSPNWIWNRYNRKREPLNEVQNEILSYLSDYLDVDLLSDKKF